MKENYLALLEKINDSEALIPLYNLMEDSDLFEENLDNLFNDKILKLMISICQEQKAYLNPDKFTEKYHEIIKNFPEHFDKIKDKFYDDILSDDLFVGANLYFVAILPVILEDIKQHYRTVNERLFLPQLLNYSELIHKDYIDIISNHAFKDFLKESPFFYSKIRDKNTTRYFIERNVIDENNIGDLLIQNKEEKHKQWIQSAYPDLVKSAPGNMDFNLLLSKLKNNYLTIKEISEDVSGIKNLDDLSDKENNTFYHAVVINNPQYLNAMAKKSPEKLYSLLSNKNNEGLNPVDIFIKEFNFASKIVLSKELVEVMNDVGLTQEKNYKIGFNDFNNVEKSHAIFGVHLKNSKENINFLKMKNLKVELDIAEAIEGRYQFGIAADLLIRNIFKNYKQEELKNIFTHEDMLYMQFYQTGKLSSFDESENVNRITSYIDYLFENDILKAEHFLESYDKKYKCDGVSRGKLINQSEDLINIAVLYSEKKQILSSLETTGIDQKVSVKKRL